MSNKERLELHVLKMGALRRNMRLQVHKKWCRDGNKPFHQSMDDKLITVGLNYEKAI